MCMLLDSESLVLLFEHNADIHIKCRSISIECSVVCILHITTSPLCIVRRHIGSCVFRIEIFDAEETSAEIHLGLKVAVAVEQREEDCFVSGEEVEKRVRELMESERGTEIRERSLKFKDMARDALGEFGSSTKALANFVHTMN